ncbi:zinc finger BED domain-containing 1-like protein [Labeo rohita]|uniref:Zinc finger BED domain-containing 1-like protein n=1 Tax=Labeo rohita TaxID=84645 RepID=A0A498MSB1_LABRO|nr:zinc finger BED domain-containing 1-like protein [Labeo rohita]
MSYPSKSTPVKDISCILIQHDVGTTPLMTHFQATINNAFPDLDGPSNIYYAQELISGLAKYFFPYATLWSDMILGDLGRHGSSPVYHKFYKKVNFDDYKAFVSFIRKYALEVSDPCHKSSDSAREMAAVSACKQFCMHVYKLSATVFKLQVDMGQATEPTPTGADTEPNASPPQKKSAMEELFGDTFVKESETDKSFSNTIKEEVASYSLPVDGGNPLAWWKHNECKYPHIAKMARHYLAVPATSVPSERVFSTAVLIPDASHP